MVDSETIGCEGGAEDTDLWLFDAETLLIVISFCHSSINMFDSLEALRGMCPRLAEHAWSRRLRVPCVWLVVDKGEVDVVVFGLATDSKPTSLKPGE
jgi:hypothetical protein